MKFNLADVFETVADSVPERIALSYQGRQISYAELDTLSNQVAHLFAGAGIGAFDNVALFLKNSIEHVTSLLGLLKVRAVPVNVNYRYTNAELQYIFDNSDSRAIIVELPEHQRSVAALLAETPTVRTVFVIGDIVEELRAAVADLPDDRATVREAIERAIPLSPGRYNKKVVATAEPRIAAVVPIAIRLP